MRLDIGPETPADYLLIPGREIGALAMLEATLADDAAFLQAAAPFWNATAAAPAFERAETSLLAAFTGWPKLTPPASTKSKRIFQLRTYESPSNGAHVRKIEMFHSGEFEIFLRAGFSSGLLWRYADRLAHAQPDLHGELCRPGGTRCEVGAIPQRPGVEEAFHQPAICLRPDCYQHYQSDPEPA